MLRQPVREEQRVTAIPTDALRWDLLQWAIDQDEDVTFFNSNRSAQISLAYPHGFFPDRLALGKYQAVDASGKDPFQQLWAYHHEQPDFLIGFWVYDLKNKLEALESRHPNRTGWPDCSFYQPRHVLDFESDTVVIRSLEDGGTLAELLAGYAGASNLRAAKIKSVDKLAPGQVKCRVSRTEYVERVRQIQRHILEGDVYELNYCIEFFAENAVIDPLQTYRQLNEKSPMPFSVFQKIGDQYLLCASPERFLKKDGRKLVSQPIKGTARRGKTIEEDERLKHHLRNNEKEQAENLMIVDLVRNDLARSAETGSVRVEELFGIYSFQQVHQMISTVSATLRENMSWADAIRHAFPMGSMTGAPKVRAMELIDQYESSRRGLYSGAVGFITPEGDFDFNVVIRSILYNEKTGYLSFSVGSAITYDADPEAEYEECLLKAQAILSVLQ
ncbi:anthranilate synthase component I family protein [Tellurirhabdus bombi]|uniref:anthranilate synthase component I family protein n=1 Tax=Tellurirhabdus bombi TaxID=2907205 RepID=UPI001F43A138|nr:anthranilate synthase component I family protein [Tellurirhabdus bombi]